MEGLQKARGQHTALRNEGLKRIEGLISKPKERPTAPPKSKKYMCVCTLGLERQSTMMYDARQLKKEG